VVSAKGLEVGKEKVHVGEPSLHRRVGRQVLVLFQLFEKIPLPLEQHVLSLYTVSQDSTGRGHRLLTNLVSSLGREPLFVNHLFPDIGPRELVELVDG